ncbi:DUF1707 domain-containing protein [Saccharomonospora xinjiangensis]|uniref:Uncharacterized protein n=1 Tax=Saccharomonospora xinjiangensis XJ-54 TaxID=882086 RepID=I0V6S9_9PSEU|nr:DUF1707 domain-containing protein [Saccharomonospora xinjiangensis]EID55832.1 protein of unknown function (DUF1707) [Saccharomonospora xinjiangensis XJ-54]
MDGVFDTDGLRIGTAEREAASHVLADHFAEGRLTTAEYEERIDRVLTARTRGDVRPLFADLPEPHPAFLTTATPATVAPAPTPAADLTTPEPSDRSAVTAGVLQIVLPFGAGRFYTGETRLAVLQLLCVVITFGMGALWPLIDGIILLTQGGTDGRGRTLR